MTPSFWRLAGAVLVDLFTGRPRKAAQIDQVAREYRPGVRASDSVANSTYGQMGMLPFTTSRPLRPQGKVRT